MSRQSVHPGIIIAVSEDVYESADMLPPSWERKGEKAREKGRAGESTTLAGEIN